MHKVESKLSPWGHKLSEHIPEAFLRLRSKKKRNLIDTKICDNETRQQSLPCEALASLFSHTRPIKSFVRVLKKNWCRKSTLPNWFIWPDRICYNLAKRRNYHHENNRALSKFKKRNLIGTHLICNNATVYERRGLDLLQRRGLLDFGRRMTKRMEKIAAVTERDVNLESGVVPSTHYISC